MFKLHAHALLHHPAATMTMLLHECLLVGGLCPGKTACTVQSPGIIHPCQWSLAGIMCPAGLQPDPCRRKPDPCTPNECSTSTHHLCAATIFGGGPPTAAHGTWCYSCASQDVVCSRALTELNVPLYNGSASIAGEIIGTKYDILLSAALPYVQALQMQWMAGQQLSCIYRGRILY